MSSKTFSPEIVEAVDELFERFDKHKNFLLDFEELKKALRTTFPMTFHKLTDVQLKSIMKMLDQDKDGAISKVEFARVFTTLQ